MSGDDDVDGNDAAVLQGARRRLYACAKDRRLHRDRHVPPFCGRFRRALLSRHRHASAGPGTTPTSCRAARRASVAIAAIAVVCGGDPRRSQRGDRPRAVGGAGRGDRPAAAN